MDYKLENQKDLEHALTMPLQLWITVNNMANINLWAEQQSFLED